VRHDARSRGGVGRGGAGAARGHERRAPSAGWNGRGRGA
jgi:hypothetical protein